MAYQTQTNNNISDSDVPRPELITCVLTSQYINYFEASVSVSASIVLIVFNLLLCFISSILNALIIKAIWSTAKLQTPTFILLCNLALTDFLIGLVIGPIEIVYLVTRALQQYEAFCTVWKILVVLSYILCPASLYTIACISYDRYLSLLMRMKYKSVVTKKKTFKALVCLWAWAIGGASFIAVLSKGPFLVLVCCIAFFCLAVITDCYIQSFEAIKERKLRVKSGRMSTTEETLSTKDDVKELELTESRANCNFRNLEADETKMSTKNAMQNTSKPKPSVSTNKDLETVARTTKAHQDSKGFGRHNLENENMDQTSAHFRLTNTNDEKAKVKRSRSINRDKIVKISTIVRHASLPPDLDKFSKTLYTIMIIVVILFLCYLPYIIVSTMVTLRIINIGIVWDLAAVIIYMNSSISPIILCTRIPNVRRACCRVLRTFFRMQ